MGTGALGVAIPCVLRGRNYLTLTSKVLPRLSSSVLVWRALQQLLRDYRVILAKATCAKVDLDPPRFRLRAVEGNCRSPQANSISLALINGVLFIHNP